MIGDLTNSAHKDTERCNERPDGCACWGLHLCGCVVCTLLLCLVSLKQDCHRNISVQSQVSEMIRNDPDVSSTVIELSAVRAEKNRERNIFINELKQGRINTTRGEEVAERDLNWRAKSPRQSTTHRSGNPRQLQRNLSRKEAKHRKSQRHLNKPKISATSSGGVQTRGSQIELEVTIRI